jgi:hypothetical protein
MRTFLVILLLAGAACDSRARGGERRPAGGLPPADPASASPPPSAPPTAPPPASPAAEAGAATLSGPLLERIDAPPYSYLRVKAAGGEQWAAVNQTDVTVGTTVSVSGSVMEAFESKTLARRFDRIVFGKLEGADPGAAAPAATEAPAGGGPVPLAEGPGATTIAALFASRASLAGKPVAVRGKVVKLNSGILGKTWIHLQDGSGSAAARDNDLAVTTSDPVKLGEIVTARGALGVDRDFGSGYRYDVIVEDATLSR